MTPFQQITVTDLNSWQSRGLRVLTALQSAALKAERYPIEWTLTTNGWLRGTVARNEPGQTDSDRRAVFDEWVHVLDGAAPRETRSMTDGIRLTSLFKAHTERGEVQGSIILEFDGPDRLNRPRRAA